MVRLLHVTRLFWLGASLVFILNSCACNSHSIRSNNSASVQPLIEPLPQDPQIRVYFNHSQASVYTEPYRPKTRLGDDLEQIIVDAINSASQSVDVAIQELRLPKIAQALVNQHQKGVRVRVIIENEYSRPFSDFTPAEIAAFSDREKGRYQEFMHLADLNQNGRLEPEEINQRDALVMLANANVPLIDDTEDGSKGSGLMHHKFVIVDQNTVIVTSANFTTSDIHGDFYSAESRGNPNNLLSINSRELAAIFTREFATMWGDGPGGENDSLFGINKPQRGVKQVSVGQGTVTVQFAPISATQPWENSVNGLIAQTLQRARNDINFALFVFSAQELSDTLKTVHQRGVEIRGLIEVGFAYRYYSEALDMMGIALPNNCRYQPGNNPWSQPISTVGVPNLAEGDRLHHKFAVIDDQIVITGSHNWSRAANHSNDETLLVVNNPTVNAHFQREFERLYQQSTLGVPGWLLSRIEREKQNCGGVIETPFHPSGEIININTASQPELESLPGIGPALAQRIIEARSQQPFTSLDDVTRVSGIGPKTIERWENLVTW
ncbi:hypothetical protein N39L_07930 [Limnospira platensis NIES-39]|uniref:phospholipase D n=1 Tax=Limnospira platensis NIES-46 TaxID=1236695 RepID=A0A5M3TBI2_LIMPL|nr:phospholipase D-like domain-containing protein [Arthrospira platensis]BAI88671.1 hypothetical protein NIES39_A08330 [Arthrospira platensis NIES-39]BDT11070.1 hypothetical protein N39L_07930 [Arthrospira platensis NIES-39]GCE95735.1 hypothetical protein NIES46_38010 [Arthrospira platensis NIES-46]